MYFKCTSDFQDFERLEFEHYSSDSRLYGQTLSKSPEIYLEQPQQAIDEMGTIGKKGLYVVASVKWLRKKYKAHPLLFPYWALVHP